MSPHHSFRHGGPFTDGNAKDDWQGDEEVTVYEDLSGISDPDNVKYAHEAIVEGLKLWSGSKTGVTFKFVSTAKDAQLVFRYIDPTDNSWGSKNAVAVQSTKNFPQATIVFSDTFFEATRRYHRETGQHALNYAISTMAHEVGHFFGFTDYSSGGVMDSATKKKRIDAGERRMSIPSIWKTYDDGLSLIKQNETVGDEGSTCCPGSDYLCVRCM